MISEKDLKNNDSITVERTNGAGADSFPADRPLCTPYQESDTSYIAWWHNVTAGWPLGREARTEASPSVVRRQGGLLVAFPSGDPLYPPAIVRPRFRRTRDGHLGAVED